MRKVKKKVVSDDEVAISDNVVREGISEEVTFQQSPNCSERESCKYHSKERK